LTKRFKLDPKVVYRQISDDGTYATCLHLICLAAYGEDIYTVDPLEILMRLEEDYGVRVTDDNEDKIKAILLATSTDIFFQDTEGFRSICETLTNGDPGVMVLEQLTLPEICWGLYEVELNHGPSEFRPEVLKLMNEIIENEAPDMEASEMDDPNSYIMDFIKESHQTLVGQLIELGVHPSDIPSVESPTMLLPGQLDVDRVQ